MCGVIDEKIIHQMKFKLKINEAYSKVRTFKGASVWVSLKEKNMLQKVMSYRLSIKNIDEVAKMLGSNACEHYFATLSKYTEGKRTNIGKMDN